MVIGTQLAHAAWNVHLIARGWRISRAPATQISYFFFPLLLSQHMLSILLIRRMQDGASSRNMHLLV